VTDIAPSRAARELSVIGPFRAHVNGHIQPLPHGVERVLAVVALAGPLGRTHASALLWPDAASGRAAANLRAALSRSALAADGFLHLSGEVLSLARDVTLDLDVAMAWAHDTIYDVSHPTVGPPPSWVGKPLLPGWDEEWLEAPNEKLQMLTAQALETAADRLLSAGHADESLPYALSAVQAQPWSESANRLTIDIHARRGDPSNALRHYRRYRRALAQELDVSPSPDMQAVIRQLYPFGNPLVETAAVQPAAHARPT
jgi:DNA-binding SARP family transcriptional activator